MAGPSLMDYIRSGFNSAVANSPLNPLRPATDALTTANQKNAQQESAAEELARLQKEGPPNALQYGSWADRVSTLKAQIAGKK